MEHHRERRTLEDQDVNFYTADYCFADRTAWSLTDVASQSQLGILPKWGFGIDLANHNCVITNGPHLGL
jgi:hypothetical protein